MQWLIPLGLAMLCSACSEPAQETSSQSADVGSTTSVADDAPPATTGTMEKGMFFGPEIQNFGLHNEYDDDGDGDGVNETHVRRYINRNGDTAFSLTTGDTLWAWSLDTKDDDTDVRKNYVIRDSNCDGVFDERYGLDAEFHVPPCSMQGGATEKPKSI